MDDFTADSTLVDYIYGGISSTAANIIFTNTETQSIGSSQIFKAYVIKNSIVGVHNLNEHINVTLKLQVFPNLSNGDLVVKFFLNKMAENKLSLYSIDGKIIEERILNDVQKGENTFQQIIKNADFGRTNILIVETPYEKAALKIMIKP